MRAERRELVGWGATAPTASIVHSPAETGDIPVIMTSAGRRGVLARGLGRAYGDAAQNAGGDVIDMSTMPPSVRLDAGAGEVTVGAGVSLDLLMRSLVPHGWFVPVTPGTRHVTVGGAIAADIHGKNHHADGSFGMHVRSLGLALADGTRRVVGPDDEPDVFWATVAGMGLTGVITDATVRLLPVESSRMLIDTERVDDLDAILARMTEVENDSRYSVAWIDLMATGRRLGRSVLTSGDHAPASAVRGRAAGAPTAFAPSEPIGVPHGLPNGLLNPMSIRAFNEVWFRKAPRHRVDEVQTLTQFFHPLDLVRNWNRLYGSRGFLQYQCVVPFGEERALQTVIERLAHAGVASFLAVLKRLGPGSPAPLSFPAPGWTLALDLAVSPGLARVLDSIDHIVLDAGGRVYLAKDSRMSPDLLSQMYMRRDEWQAVRDRLDPAGRMQSDLGRRFGLVGRSTTP